MVADVGSLHRSAAPPLGLLLGGWASYLPVGVVLIFSYDDRYVTPALIAAGVLAIVLHFVFGALLHRRVGSALLEYAILSYFLAFGGCFLALSLLILADDPNVFSFFGLETMQWKCWYCPGWWEQTVGALVTSLVLALHAPLMAPVSWRLFNR